MTGVTRAKAWFTKGIQAALKGTEGTKVTENPQNADFRRKPQIFADSPLLLEIQAFGGRRKPQISAENRRFSGETAGNRSLGSVTLGPSPSARPKAWFLVP